MHSCFISDLVIVQKTNPNCQISKSMIEQALIHGSKRWGKNHYDELSCVNQTTFSTFLSQKVHTLICYKHAHEMHLYDYHYINGQSELTKMFGTRKMTVFKLFKVTWENSKFAEESSRRRTEQLIIISYSP